MGDAKKNRFPGSCPEFGAIFMSDNATKRECFRRKVFALPSSQSHFVKQIKAGMILFLFEFERRELYGVFQACSDGAMNIVPHVLSLSGKHFPAQVKFTLMWHCYPLSENEFCDAIRENYFSKTKFNFGLSEDQVRRLLSLFSLKRMEGKAPPRLLTESKVARQSGYSTSKNRRLVDKSPMRNHGRLVDKSPMRNHGRLVDKSPMRNQVPSEYGVDNLYEPDISSFHQGDSFYNDDRSTDDDRFGMYTYIGYEHKASAFLNDCFRDHVGKDKGDTVSGKYATSDMVDTEWKSGMDLQQADSVGYSSGNFRSISNDVRFVESDRIETKCYKDDGFAPTISTAYPCSFQSKVNPLVYSSKHVLETDSFMNHPTRPSSMSLPSMEMQNSNVCYPMNFEDQNAANSLPYDSDVPTTNYRGGSSLGFNQGHASLQDASRDSSVGHVIGTSKNQAFPSLLETRTPVTSDVYSGSRDFVTLPYSNSYEQSGRTILRRADYLDDPEAEYSKIECCGDLSLPMPSLSPVPSSEIRNNGRLGEHSLSRTRPSKFPSLTFSDRYPTLLQDTHDFQVQESDRYPTLLQDGHDFQVQESDRYPTLLQDRHDFQVQESDRYPTLLQDGHDFQVQESDRYPTLLQDRHYFQVQESDRYPTLLQDRHDFQVQESNRYPMLLRDRHDFQVQESDRYPTLLRNRHEFQVQESDRYPTLLQDRHDFQVQESDRYPTLLQDRHDSQVQESESDAQFGNDGFMFKECQPHGESFYNDNRTVDDGRLAIYNTAECENKEGQQQLHVHEPINMDYHEVTLLSPAPYQNSDRRKKRSSVFSRLALPPKMRQKESNTSPVSADIDRHTSVDEIMGMLHRSHKHWAKTSGKPLVKHNAAAANLKDKKQATRKDDPAVISKEMNLKSTSFSKENSCKKAGGTTFVDFKRRSAVRKNLEDGKTGNHCETRNVKSAAAAQCKKRKLIRPDFCESEPSDRGISGDAPQLSILPSTECSLKNNAESIRVSVVHVNEKDISRNVKLPNAMCQTAVKGTNSDKGSGSNPEQFSVENFIDSRSADGGKESSKRHCISSMTSISCRNTHVEVEQDMTTRDTGMDELSQDRNDVNHHSTHESSTKICEDSDGDGVAKREFVHGIGQMNDLTSGLSQDLNDVSNHSTRESSQKICGDNDGNGAAKNDFVYSLQQINDLSPGLSQDRNDVSHHSTHESSQNICEGNDGDGIAKSDFVYGFQQMNDLTPGLSQDRDDVSHSTHESSPKICEDNDGDGTAKKEFVYNIEQMNGLTPVGDEISISTLN